MFEIAASVFWGHLITAILFPFSLPVFIPLSLPGLALCYLLRKYLKSGYWIRSMLMSLSLIGFMSPYIYFSGHLAVVLPLPIGIYLTLRGGCDYLLSHAALSIALSALVCGYVTYHYWNREKAGTPVVGRFERLWRAR